MRRTPGNVSVRVNIYVDRCAALQAYSFLLQVISNREIELNALKSRSVNWIGKVKNIPLSKHDEKVLLVAVLAIVLGIVVSFAQSTPSLTRQGILLSLIATSYIVGFCETARARVWGAIFVMINLWLWLSDSLAAYRALHGIG